MRWQGVGFPNADVVLLLPFAALIVAAASADLVATRSWLTSRPMTYAGELSFAFYIIQYPVLLEVHKHVTRPWPATLIALAATIGASVALHHVVERPVQRLIAPRRLHPVPSLSGTELAPAGRGA
jgi:peptidoglycan/LPS O-acetylase OafA/YrhL